MKVYSPILFITGTPQSLQVMNLKILSMKHQRYMSL